MCNKTDDLRYDINDVLDAVQYGFKYAIESQNDGESVPIGNILQWLMYKKNLTTVPESWKELKESF